MDINKYIEKYNPKAIFLKGSKMLGLAPETSDTDIEILLDSQTLPNSYKENGIDIFFINYDLQIKSINESLNEIALLQYLFVKPEHILYKSNDFDFESFKKKIEMQMDKILIKFIKRYWNNIRYYSYSFLQRKLAYHICYLSLLVGNIALNFDKVKKIKLGKATKDEIDYFEFCRKKLLSFYLRNLKEDYENI